MIPAEGTGPDGLVSGSSERPGPRERRRPGLSSRDLVDEPGPGARGRSPRRSGPASTEPAQPAVAAVGIRLVVEAADRGEDAAVAGSPTPRSGRGRSRCPRESGRRSSRRRAFTVSIQPSARIVGGVHAAVLEQVVLDLVEHQRVDVRARPPPSRALRPARARLARGSSPFLGPGDRRGVAWGSSSSPFQLRARARARAASPRPRCSRARRSARGTACPARRAAGARRRPASSPGPPATTVLKVWPIRGASGW